MGRPRRSEVLTHRTNEMAKEWRHLVLDKVTYFSDDELVAPPRGETDAQVWVFKRDGMFYGIASRQFFSRPV